MKPKKNFFKKSAFGQWLGIELDVVSLKEKLISLVGGIISILLLMGICEQVLGLKGSAMLISSMGASAVLLFGVPHGALSQPWPVVMGHFLSAVIGVTCAKMISVPYVAAACAVGLSIGAMHQLKCIHPPGGATALTAVLGGNGIRELGYSFVWHPVLLNAVVMVLVAVGFNYLFAWRRYPAAWGKRHRSGISKAERVSHQDIVEALESFDSFVDITEEDLIRLHELLSKREKRSKKELHGCQDGED
ncbi:MAG: HPP family protein [Verrucomicrobiota bacterium]